MALRRSLAAPAPCPALQVRAEAFTALITLLDVVGPDVRKARVLPVLHAHMQPYDLDSVMQRCVARNFGVMMTVVRGRMGQERGF